MVSKKIKGQGDDHVKEREEAIKPTSGFVLKSTKENKTLYFAGDSGYGPHFSQIKAKLGAPALSLLAIGAYEPRWIMTPVHMSPEDAVLAHEDLDSGMTIGMHFGTFRMADEGLTLIIY